MQRVRGNLQGEPEMMARRPAPRPAVMPNIPNFSNIPNMPNLQGIGGIPGLQNIDFSKLPQGLNFSGLPQPIDLTQRPQTQAEQPYVFPTAPGSTPTSKRLTTPMPGSSPFATLPGIGPIYAGPKRSSNGPDYFDAQGNRITGAPEVGGGM